METKNNNKLIAEFMGYKVMEEDKFLAYDYPKGTDLNKVMVDVAIKYHTDWNWLMPVVEKIESMSHTKGRHYFLAMGQAYVGFEIDRMNVQPFAKWGTSSNYRKKEAVYEAVVEFIQWHNNNLKQTTT